MAALPTDGWAWDSGPFADLDCYTNACKPFRVDQNLMLPPESMSPGVMFLSAYDIRPGKILKTAGFRNDAPMTL